MGFWSQLGSDLLSGAANSVTGGTAGALIDAAKIAAPIVTDIAQNQKNNQQLKYAQASEAQQNQTNTDKTALAAKAELANEQAQAANTAIAEEAAKEKQQQDAYDKARKAGLALNEKDVNIDLSSLPGNVPTLHFTGGLRPSAYGPEGQAAASTLSNQALQQLANGVNLPAVPTPTPFTLTQPNVPTPPTDNFWESLAEPLGFGLTALSQAHPGQQAASSSAANAGVLRPPADTRVGATPVPTTPQVPQLPASIFGQGLPPGLFSGPPLTLPPPFDPTGGG